MVPIDRDKLRDPIRSGTGEDVSDDTVWESRTWGCATRPTAACALSNGARSEPYVLHE